VIGPVALRNKTKEGFIMAAFVPDSPRRRISGFQSITAAFLSEPGLPFANLLTAEKIEHIFAKHGNLFGLHGVYSTAMMVWSFLGQVLRDGKEASCQSAVARVVTYYQQNRIPETWRGLSDCPGGGHDFAGHRLRNLHGPRKILRQGNRRAGTIPINVWGVARGSRCRGRPLLLLIHDDRITAWQGGPGMREDACKAARRLSTRQTTRKIRPHHPVEPT